MNVETMDDPVTNEHVLEKSVKCAVWLRKKINEGDVITVLPSKSDMFYAPVLAGLFVGAVVNIWDVNCRCRFLRFARPNSFVDVAFAAGRRWLEGAAESLFVFDCRGEYNADEFRDLGINAPTCLIQWTWRRCGG